MRMAVIDGAAVINVIEAPADFKLEGFTLRPTNTAGIGWTFHPGINTFSAPEQPEPIVPASVTMRQARLALLGAGKLSQVESSISALPEPDRSTAQIEWEYAAELKRDHPLIAAIGTGLGMTSAEVDALFIQAAAIA